MPGLTDLISKTQVDKGYSILMQTEATHADVEMYDVVFVHVCDALTDLT